MLIQVLKKRAVGITTLNLTKNTFTKQVLRDLKENYYSFVYLVCFDYLCVQWVN